MVSAASGHKCPGPSLQTWLLSPQIPSQACHFFPPWQAGEAESLSEQPLKFLKLMECSVTHHISWDWKLQCSQRAEACLQLWWWLWPLCYWPIISNLSLSLLGGYEGSLQERWKVTAFLSIWLAWRLRTHPSNKERRAAPTRLGPRTARERLSVFLPCLPCWCFSLLSLLHLVTHSYSTPKI